MVKKLRKGDIVLVHGDGFYNKVVRFFTQSKWGHVVMVIDEGHYIESNNKGVVVRPIQTLLEYTCIVRRYYKITPLLERMLVNEALRYEGKPYDFFAILQLLILLALGRRHTSEYTGDKNKYICSELAAKPYYAFGMNVKDNIVYDNIIPDDFATSDSFYTVGELHNIIDYAKDEDTSKTN